MFSAARVSLGAIQRRILGSGDAIPVMESFFHAGTDSGGTNNLVLTKPSGTVEGNYLIAAVVIDEDGSAISPPSDVVPWVEHYQQDTDRNAFGVWTKFAGGSEPASYDFTWGDSDEIAGGIILRFSGIDPANPINVSSNNKANSGGDGNIILLGVITTITNCLLVHLVGTDKTSISVGVLGEPGGSEVVHLNDSHGGNSGILHGGATEDFVGGGGTGNIVWQTENTGNAWSNVLIALAPPAV